MSQSCSKKRSREPYAHRPPRHPLPDNPAHSRHRTFPRPPRISEIPEEQLADLPRRMPFLAMLEHHEASASPVPMHLLYSARSIHDVIGRTRPSTTSDAEVTITRRAAPDDWQGPRGRIDDALLNQHAVRPDRMPHMYICGPTSFVETATMLMLRLGHDPAAIRTERFGTTGGPP